MQVGVFPACLHVYKLIYTYSSASSTRMPHRGAAGVQIGGRRRSDPTFPHWCLIERGLARTRRRRLPEHAVSGRPSYIHMPVPASFTCSHSGKACKGWWLSKLIHACVCVLHLRTRRLVKREGPWFSELVSVGKLISLGPLHVHVLRTHMVRTCGDIM